MNKVLVPGNAFISDITANNIETLFCDGTKTLAALADLVNIIQAAILSEKLVIAMRSQEISSFLRDLDCTAVFEVSETQDTPQSSIIEGNSTDAEYIDEIALQFVQSMHLARDPVFANLLNLHSIDEIKDKGFYAFSKFPVSMMMMELQYSAMIFDSSDAYDSVTESLSPSIDVFRNYAASLVDIYNVYGMYPVTSVIENPMLDSNRIEVGSSFDQLDDMRIQIGKKINRSVEDFRSLALSSYDMPALGIHVLSNVKSLDELPKEISRTREKFLKLRESIVSLEKERKSAYQDTEKGLPAINRIKVELQTAFNAFDEKIDIRSKKVRHIKTFMDGAKLWDGILGIILSLGLNVVSSTEKILDAFKIRNKLEMKLVPGLFEASSFINSCSVESVSSIVERYIGLPPAKFVFPQIALQMGFAEMEAIFSENPKERMKEIINGRYIQGTDMEMSLQGIWFNILRDETWANVWLAGRKK